MSGTQKSEQGGLTGDVMTGEGSDAKTEGEGTKDTKQEDRSGGTEPDKAETKQTKTNNGDERYPPPNQEPDDKQKDGEGEGEGGREGEESLADGENVSQEGEGNLKDGEKQVMNVKDTTQSPPDEGGSINKTKDDTELKDETKSEKVAPTEPVEGDNIKKDTTEAEPEKSKPTKPEKPTPTEPEKPTPTEPVEGDNTEQDYTDTESKGRENTDQDTTDVEPEKQIPTEKVEVIKDTVQDDTDAKPEKLAPTEPVEGDNIEQDTTDTEPDKLMPTEPVEGDDTEENNTDTGSDKQTRTEPEEREKPEQDTTDTKLYVEEQISSPKTPDTESTAGNTEQTKEQTIIPQAETNTGVPVVGADTDHQGQNGEVPQENGNKENLPAGDDFNGEEKLKETVPEPQKEINQQEPPNQEKTRSLSETMRPVDDSHPEGNEEEDVFLDAKEKTENVNFIFIENRDQQPLANVLENCHRYKTELQLGLDLEEAQKEYQNLLKRTKETQSLETVSQMQKNEPPCELNYVNEDGRREAPMLYGVISIVSEKCPISNWRDAVREFITLTTYSKSEPQRSKNQRPRSSSGYQKKTQKKYRNNIEKLLDQEWQSDFIPKSAVEYDYRHFFTSESVLRSSFPDAYIFDLANSKISSLEDVPMEFRNRTLCTFLETINMKKFGVDPREAWRDYGRCILAEKQLDLARRAVGPDLDKNMLINKQTYYKIQNELQEKTQEIEELSTRLSKFASQQLTEGNPNIADLSDTHRPTRLGEMYSQLFDDEWSEAFEAFKPKKEEDEDDDDDDIFPDTLFVLQNMLRESFEFCKNQSQKQMTELEDGFATITGLKEPKKIKKKEEGKSIETQTNWEEKVESEEMKEGGGGDAGDDRQETDPSVNVDAMDKSTEQSQLSNEAVDKSEASVEGDTPVTEDTGDNKEQNDTSENNDTNNDVSEKDEAKEKTHEPSQPSDQSTEPRDQNTPAGQETNPETQQTNNGANNSDNEGTEKTELKGKKEEVSQIDQKGDIDGQETVPSKEMDKKDDTKMEKKETPDTDATLLEKKDEQAEIPVNTNTADESGGQSCEQTGKDGTSNLEEKEKPQVEKPEREEERPDDGQDDRPEVKEGQEMGPEEAKEEIEDRPYRTDPSFPMIERHARDFRKAAAGTSAQTKSKLFIEMELPTLVKDEDIRSDIRTLMYARKCVELCWYMCMQDPPMVIITPQKGEEIDKGLFSFHGRRGKTVEVCVWPALLLHDNGPLVCKGYILPEERKRKK
ncbi:enolase-phosphatase E1-like isoform X2 [Ostrea edulis]|uniref:enolase-phosphatase E1-like isoform X2 n=1 Tax=Ostrea edulis TaxID=37623 RepID=UPI0024AE9801|nr:enolase-phosphatase E1-like isoform X2 [Ostrea edulis]